jgi:hypothetical protein
MSSFFAAFPSYLSINDTYCPSHFSICRRFLRHFRDIYLMILNSLLIKQVLQYITTSTFLLPNNYIHFILHRQKEVSSKYKVKGPVLTIILHSSYVATYISHADILMSLPYFVRSVPYYEHFSFLTLGFCFCSVLCCPIYYHVEIIVLLLLLLLLLSVTARHGLPVKIKVLGPKAVVSEQELN